MRPTSTRFKAQVRESNVMAVRAAVLSVGRDPVDVPLLSGSVTLDASAASRGRMTAVLVDDGTLGLVPTDAQSLLAPYGNELQLWRGVRYSDGTQELVSLGVFAIEVTGTEDSGSGHDVSVSGLDRSGKVIAARFEEPYGIFAGTNVETAITATIRPVMPGLVTAFPGVKFVTPLIVVEEQADRWKLCQDIATACGVVLFFDGDGVLRLGPLLGGYPVASYVEGEGGLLIACKREWRREGSYNVAIVTGENTGGDAPVRAVAMDLNADSPTYVNGRFGRVPVFLSTSLVTTVEQAQAAADALLRRQLGTTETVGFDAVADPSLEPGDGVQITRKAVGVDEVHMIDQLTVPLDATAAMSATTRAIQTIGGFDQVQVDITRMVELGLADRRASLARSIAVSDASIGSQLTEDWVSLAAWSSTAGAQQVSGGRVFSASAGDNAGIARAFVVPDSSDLRVTTQVRTVAGNGGTIVVGVSSDPPGVAPTARALPARGLCFGPTGQIYKWDQGRATVLATPLTGTQDWQVTFTTDRLGLYAAAQDLATGQVVWTAFPRYGQAINNVFIFNADTRNLAGASVGPVSARAALATVTPAGRVTGPTVETGLLQGGLGLARCVLPPGFDSRAASPVVFGFHGANTGMDIFDQFAFAGALVNAGYIFLSSAYLQNLNTWGNAQSLATALAAYHWLRDRYPVGPLVLCGYSMGGIESLAMLAARELPGIAGWFGVHPSLNLDYFYDTAVGGTASINAAYGTGSRDAYKAATVGRNPMEINPRLFRGVPMLFLSSSDDVSAPRAQNSALLYPRVAPYCDATILDGTGGHGVIPPEWTAPILSFVNECVA